MPPSKRKSSLFGDSQQRQRSALPLSRQQLRSIVILQRSPTQTTNASRLQYVDNVPGRQKTEETVPGRKLSQNRNAGRQSSWIHPYYLIEKTQRIRHGTSSSQLSYRTTTITFYQRRVSSRTFIGVRLEMHKPIQNPDSSLAPRTLIGLQMK